MSVRPTLGGRLGAGVLALACSALAATAAAEPLELSLQQALALARERSGLLLLAEAEAAATAREMRETALPLGDPSIEIAAGPRFGEQDRLEAELSWSRPFEPRGQRDARAGAALARSEAAEAETRRVRLDVLTETAKLHASALHAQALLELADEDATLAGRLLEGAVARRESGDASRLEESLARASLARSVAVRSRAEASLARAAGRLRAVLGLHPERALTLVGELAPAGETLDAAPLDGDRHPLVAALRADAREAEADIERARASGRSARGVFAAVAREEDATVLRGGMSWTLPVRGRGHALAAAAALRREGLRVAEQVETARIEALRAAESEAAVVLTSGARDFATTGLPSLREAAALLEEAYRLGAYPLIDVIAMRRETVAARRESLDLFLEAALARHEARRAAGREPEP